MREAGEGWLVRCRSSALLLSVGVLLLVAASATGCVDVGNLEEIATDDLSCEGDHAVTVDAVVVASSSEFTPVGTTRRELWSVYCSGQELDLTGAWPPAVDDVRAALTRAALPLDCPAGSRGSTFEAVPDEEGRRVFAPGTRSVGWFVTDLTGDGCDVEDGVRWEFRADVGVEESDAGSPGHLPPGRIDAALAVPLFTGPLALSIEWGECDEFSCTARMRAVDPANTSGFQPRVLDSSTRMFGAFDPTAGSADLVLYGDCRADTGSVLADLALDETRLAVVVRSADGAPLQQTGALEVEVPSGAFAIGAADGTCTEAERAVDAMIATETFTALVTGRSGSGAPPTTTTAPPRFDPAVDIPATGSVDRSLAADLDLAAEERSSRITRSRHRTAYALSEWGPFVAWGIVTVAVLVRARRRRLTAPRRAHEDDPLDMVRESIELAAFDKRVDRSMNRSLARGMFPWIGVYLAGLIVPVIVVDDRWLDIYVPRYLVTGLGLMLVAGGVALAAGSVRKRRIRKRLLHLELRLRRCSDPPVDVASVLATMVATIDGIEDDDTVVEVRNRTTVHRYASSDDFDAARMRAVVLCDLVLPAEAAVGRLERPPDLAPVTVAAEQFLERVTRTPASRADEPSRPAADRARRAAAPAPSTRQRVSVGSILGSRELRRSAWLSAVWALVGAGLLVASTGVIVDGGRGVFRAIAGLLVGGSVIASSVRVVLEADRTAKVVPVITELTLVARTPSAGWYEAEPPLVGGRFVLLADRDTSVRRLTVSARPGPGAYATVVLADGTVVVGQRAEALPPTARRVDRPDRREAAEADEI